MDPYKVPPKQSKLTSVPSGEGQTSSAMSKNDYEVFLSFRGPDTRQGLSDCIYNAMIDVGIVVFRDDDELAVGDKIDDILLALNNSKICVVVLSPTFADSAWCLREVERMVGMKKDIVPIFCHVTPDDVKLKTELYANAIIVHENKHGKERVQQWRDALKEIPTIKGRALKNTGFVEFSRQIAKEILTKLKVKHKYEIMNFVEVPDEVETALKLLDIGAGGCRYLGIHGMGGIGKTTLAKVIFNQISNSFDCFCFLENIRETISQSQGDIHKLQEQLLRSLDPSVRHDTHIVNGLEKIKNNFVRKKVILVLDDIDEKNHLHGLVGSFGSGSRIIFTTRKKRLHEQVISSNVDVYDLELTEMDSKQSLKLFSRHAFGEDFPPRDFDDLSMEVISSTGGLPLALEVVGSFLHRQKAKVWRDMIRKLKEAPHQDVQRTLMISYSALEYEQQEIFLDIACFFIDNGQRIHKENDKAYPIFMWDAYGFHPNHGIEVLMSMSLIKINDKKLFWMHDQLRDFGRAIVKANSKDARGGSRIWIHEEALDLFRRNEGKSKLEALHLDGPSIYLDRENFVGLERLRFLRLTECANFGGDFGGLIPKLRWLSLRNASSFHVSNLCLRELVVLELSKCRYDQTWPGWGQILISEQLKVVTLSHCHGLLSTPDLSKVVNLERLVLEKCGSLTSLHSSIGKLQWLRRLSILECENLHEFPEELTSLESLKQIVFRCWSMSSQLQLPESIGCLVTLTRLELRKVVHLPSSIGELVKLKHLCVRDSYNLRVLPDSIGNLRSLIRLDLSNTSITELPTTIGGLAQLESLCLTRCTELQRLPDSIGNLYSLVDLNMSNCASIVVLPHSFGNLSSLQDLDMSNCLSIAELPQSFENLASLHKLNLMGSRIRSLPVSLENLESLDIGDRSGGSWIRELSELPIGLTRLNIRRVQKIQNLSNLINLSELEIHNANFLVNELVEFDGIEKLPKLKRLFIECSSVKYFSMECGALQQLKSLTLCSPFLELGQCQLPRSLESLSLQVQKWGQLPSNLSTMKNLSQLMLWSFVIEEANCVEELKSLEYLKMSICILKFKEFPILKRLKSLTLDNCRSHFTSLLDLDERKPAIGSEFQTKLSNLENLSMLALVNFSIPEDDGFEVIGAEGLKSVELLQIKECSLIEITHNVSMLRHLTSLYLENCSFPPMTSLDIPQLDRLVEMYMVSCENFLEIQGFEKLKSLTKLCILCCDSLRRIDGLVELNALQTIDITSCQEFEGIDGIDRLLSIGTLNQLDIKGCKCDDARYPSTNF